MYGGRWQHFLKVLLKGAKLVTILAQGVLHQLPEDWLGEVVVGQLWDRHCHQSILWEEGDRKIWVVYIPAPGV